MVKCAVTKDVIMVKKEVDVYQLTLSAEEAQTLLDIARRVGGSIDGCLRHIQAIEKCLRNIGIEPNNIAGDIDTVRYTSIYFVQ